jgi:hypothetical protein
MWFPFLSSPLLPPPSLLSQAARGSGGILTWKSFGTVAVGRAVGGCLAAADLADREAARSWGPNRSCTHDKNARSSVRDVISPRPTAV